MVRYLRRRRLFYYVRNRNNLRLLRALLTIVILCFLTVYLDARFRPVVAQMAEARAQNIATRTINDAISDTISKNAEQYKEILVFEKDNTGAITALRTNMVAINTLKTEVTGKVIDSLSAIDQREMGIPLGNLAGWNFLSGRGPLIPVKILPVGSAETNFLSVFTSAGINQTKHQIVMESKVWVNIILPGRSIKKEISTDVNIAETILVGEVPEGYTYIDDQRSDDLLSKINDYQAK